jgi:hypothetical protein
VITNIGKNILAKYLIGQASSYASFIALGVGSRPLAGGDQFPDFSFKEQLDFEVLRIPIISRGFVYDNDGNPNVVFLGEIPSDQRYGITEVGIYPGISNPSAGNLDSKILYSFSESENWEYHTENSAVGIETILTPLNLDEASGTIAVSNVVFRTNSNNTIFSGPLRLNVFERPRFLDRALVLRGDMSFLISSNGKLSVAEAPGEYFGSHIHYNGVSLDLDSNSSEDELRLAFSVLKKDELDSEAVLESVKILIDFVNADVDSPNLFARFEVDLNQSDSDVDFTDNRYFVVKKKFAELTKSPNFTWNAVNSVRIYCTAIENGQSTPSDNFYVALDGLRFENTTIKNPLYGLTGYSVIKNINGRPIIKESNTSNSIEFRFGLDVQ